MMDERKERVVVFKDAKTREIHTYIDINGHGARMTVDQFMELVSEAYGNPTLTVSKKGHQKRLKIAAGKAIHKMKEKTAFVAGQAGAKNGIS